MPAVLVLILIMCRFFNYEHFSKSFKWTIALFVLIRISVADTMRTHSYQRKNSPIDCNLLRFSPVRSHHGNTKKMVFGEKVWTRNAVQHARMNSLEISFWHLPSFVVKNFKVLSRWNRNIVALFICACVCVCLVLSCLPDWLQSYLLSRRLCAHQAQTTTTEQMGNDVDALNWNMQEIVVPRKVWKDEEN